MQARRRAARLPQRAVPARRRVPRANLDTYADTNNLEILYPQAIASIVPYNPEGCWDWWGYDGPNFAVKSAPQMVAIMNMVHALGG